MPVLAISFTSRWHRNTAPSVQPDQNLKICVVHLRNNRYICRAFDNNEIEDGLASGDNEVLGATADAVQERSLSIYTEYAHNMAAAEAVPASEPMPATYYNAFSNEGILLAVSIVSASLIGRMTSQEARLDVRKVERTRKRSRAFNKELRQKREEWQVQEAARIAVAEAQRVAEATIRTRSAAKEQAELRRKYEEDAAREQSRVVAEQEAARRVYEQQQAVLDAEYQARVEQEQKLLKEALQKAKEEEERRKVEAEKQFQLQEEERRRREDLERAAREAAERQRIEERRRLDKEKQHFAVRIEGSVTVERPTKGTILPGPLHKEATVRLILGAGSLLGGPGTPAASDFASHEDAKMAVSKLVGSKVRIACDDISSVLRLKSMANEGPMASMDQPEQEHWMAMTTARTAVEALAAAEASLQTFCKEAIPQTSEFNVRTEFGILAADHPQGPQAVMGRAIALIENGETDAAVQDVLADNLRAENESFYADLKSIPDSMCNAPRVLGSVLELAHFLGRVLHDRPAKSSDAPVWFESSVAVVRRQLKVLFQDAPSDSLDSTAAIVCAALGPSHPVACEVFALADANVSAAKKAQRLERERIHLAELAEKLLEEDWPDAAEIRAARMEERESKTPIAERVWALRNVAGTLAMGGPGERSRARQLLEQAVLLKQHFAGSPDHPAVLPELVALADVLATEPDWATDSAGVASLVLRVLGSIAEAYSRAGDGVSAALIMEAGLRQYEEASGVRGAAVRAATRRSDALIDALTSEQKEIVASKRRLSKEIISRVTSAMTEQLGAYQEGTARSKVKEWDEKGSSVIGPLVAVDQNV